MKLRLLEIIDAKDRISTTDIFRGLAIIPVVFFHFHHILPYGYLGVDLFFVFSGFLLGSILIKKFRQNEKISFFFSAGSKSGYLILGFYFSVPCWLISSTGT